MIDFVSKTKRNDVQIFPYDNPKETIYVRFEKADFPGLGKEFDRLSFEDFGHLEANIYQEIRMYLDALKDCR